jgi:hypothetical protein
MRDSDVRRALCRKVLAEHIRDPGTLVVQELGLWHGGARVDIAVVNGRFHGFEIKSDADSLGRLEAQRVAYSAVFDRVTLVCGSRHAAAIQEKIPDWWGLKIATSGKRGAVHLEEIRQSQQNANIDPTSLAGMLWRDEALALLLERGIAGVRSKSRGVLCRLIASHVPLDVVRAYVRKTLKVRAGWRSDAQRVTHDDSLPLFATS